MSEGKIKIIPFSVRVKENDKTFLDNFLSEYKVKHEGVSVFIDRLKNENTNPDINEEHSKLVTENERLTKENGELRQAQVMQQNCYLIEFTPPFILQLTKLRRYLKSKNQIPAESTEIEFMQKFISESTEKQFIDKYYFLNRD